MSVAVIKQQSTLDEFGFRNLYNTLPRYSPTQQAKNVEQYMQQRRKENAGIEDIAAPANIIGRNKILFDGTDMGEHFDAADIIQEELATSSDPTKFKDYLTEDVDYKTLPAVRDYFSRQTTLPEHMWNMTTEGKHFDEEGNMLPGAIPPVNAVKIISRNPNLSRLAGYGLVPNIHSKQNERYERHMAEMGYPVFPTSQGLGFVAPAYAQDIENTIAANVHGAGGYGGWNLLQEHPDTTQLVGIRGFGVPQDKAFARPEVGEGREGAFTEPIPPERLVGVFNREIQDYEDLPAFEEGEESYFDIKNKLPGSWRKGRFSLDNPALSREEKQRIATEIIDKLKSGRYSSSGYGGRRRGNLKDSLFPAQQFIFGDDGND